MSDASSTPPAYQPTPPPQPSAFPPMPKNPAAAMGFAAGYFGGTNPGTLAFHAVLLIVAGAFVGFLWSVIPTVVVLHPMLSFIQKVLEGIGLICFVIAAARFIADGFRGR